MLADVIQGTYNGKAVAIKTLKNVDPEGVETFLAEADVMTFVDLPAQPNKPFFFVRACICLNLGFALSADGYNTRIWCS